MAEASKVNFLIFKIKGINFENICFDKINLLSLQKRVFKQTEHISNKVL